MDIGDLFDEAPAVAEADRLTLDLDGWEGPLDLLLTLARNQKVDLAKISILALTDQYLAFIADAKKLKLEIAADYLVMAAWLAYLKSCLLLPKDPQVDPSPEELALRLQLRLQRLGAMREAGARLLARDRIGRDVFARGAPEGLRVVRKSAWQVELYDLIAAYGIVRARAGACFPCRFAAAGDDAGGGAAPGRAADRRQGRLDRYQKLSARQPGWRISSLGAGLELRRGARAGAKGQAGAGPVGSVRAALRPRRMIGPGEDLRAVEATLFAASEPLSVADIADHVGPDVDVAEALAMLGEHYAGRGVELVERGGRWHFQTAPDLAHILRRERDEARKLSRAAVETLAIIAYHEPVSRAEIEAIRGVQISKGTLDVLMEAGWVRPAGRREVPGRPLTYATTVGFLAHFGLQSRRDLPGIDDLKAAGLLDPIDTALGQLELETEGEED